MDGDELFYAQQNALLVKNAEEYYRLTYHPGMYCHLSLPPFSLTHTHIFCWFTYVGSVASTWNVRDKHMCDTIHNIYTHVTSKINKPAKTVVWGKQGMGSSVGTKAQTDRTAEGYLYSRLTYSTQLSPW